MDITRAKIRELRKALDGKEIGAEELCGEYFKKIKITDPKLLSYITVTEDKAKEMAAAAQKLIDEGKSSALTGIPLAIKDNICVEGVRTTCSSKMLENFVPPYNATVIEKLNAEGYVLLGKTSMDEFAMGGRKRRCCFRVPRTCRARKRHGRLYPPAERILRSNGNQAHLRQSVPLRACRVRKLSRPDRSYLLRRAGLRSNAERYLRSGRS